MMQMPKRWRGVCTIYPLEHERSRMTPRKSTCTCKVERKTATFPTETCRQNNAFTAATVTPQSPTNSLVMFFFLYYLQSLGSISLINRCNAQVSVHAVPRAVHVRVQAVGVGQTGSIIRPRGMALATTSTRCN